MNYLREFHDIHLDLGRSEERQVFFDFVVTLADFLKSLGVRGAHAEHVAELLYRSMSHRGVHYHTPPHPLRMFCVAEEMGLNLSNAEKLAIWFHDAFWRPDKDAENEINSSMFLMGLLEGLLPQELLGESTGIIEDTALYMQDGVSERSWAVMDLDLSHFAAEEYFFWCSGEAIRKEFAVIYRAEEIKVGRAKFLRDMLQRKRLFRTPEFFAAFEDKARVNLKKALDQLEAE
jgi:predicted metal-dependent HD superfamily phosphohydrolase